MNDIKELLEQILEGSHDPYVTDRAEACLDILAKEGAQEFRSKDYMNEVNIDEQQNTL